MLSRSVLRQYGERLWLALRGSCRSVCGRPWLLYPWSSGIYLVWPIFSGRNAKLETMNRILTDAARKRTERIEELETQVTQLERQVVELEPARKRTRELEVVAAERADLVNE